MKMKIYVVISLVFFLVAHVYCATENEATEDNSSDDESSSSSEAVVGNPEAKSGYEMTGYGYEQQRPQVFFGGQYGGRCDQDGFYFNDENSFITCNHGIAYVQQCAPGTRNGAAGSYRAGGYYTHTAFCDINLVDFGYAAYHSQRGGYGSSGYGGQSSQQAGYGSAQRSSGYGSQQQQSRGGYSRKNSGYGKAYGVGQPKSGYESPSAYSSSSYGRSKDEYGSRQSSRSTYERKSYGQSYGVSQPKSYNSGYGSSSRYGGSSGSYGRNSGYGNARGSSSGYQTQTQQRTSYRPTYQIFTYRPSSNSYQSYKQPKQQQSYSSGGYKQQNQGHTAYGRKYTGYYSQRRYH